MRAKVSFLLLLCLFLAAGCASGGGATKSSTPSAGIITTSANSIAPTNLKAQATDKTITLNWDMAKWEDRYVFDIYRWQPGHEPQPLDSVPAGVHTYTDPSAANGKYYFYAVVARNVGATLSDASAQIAMVSLDPPAPVPVYDPLAGYLPPSPYYTDATKDSWVKNRLEQLRDEIPYTFVSETCPTCDGRGVIVLTTATNGAPDLAVCPVCGGRGAVTHVYPKA